MNLFVFRTNNALCLFAQFCGVDRDGVSAVVRLVDSNKSVIGVNTFTYGNVIAERDHDELGILRPLLDVMGDDADVPEVQSGIDLIHHIERGRFVVMQREH